MRFSLLRISVGLLLRTRASCVFFNNVINSFIYYLCISGGSGVKLLKQQQLCTFIDRVTRPTDVPIFCTGKPLFSNFNKGF